MTTTLIETIIAIACGHCRFTHASLAEVRQCAAEHHSGKRCAPWKCSWLVERPFCRQPECGMCEDGGHPPTECGAWSRQLFNAAGREIGYECTVGHDHIDAQARMEEGWDYAADPGEAALLAKYGTEPRHMDGHVWVEPLPAV